MTTLSDADDPATVLADADDFFQRWFAATDADEVLGINANFGVDKFPGYWSIGSQISALVQVHDLVAPLDPDRAAVYLQRLGVIAIALWENRDDHRGFPEDPFRGKVMAAWGAFTANRDHLWNTDPVTSGLFIYAMAAFARRVAAQPDRHASLKGWAIGMITAALETCEAFRPELHLVDSDPHAWYFNPLGYRRLQCRDYGSCVRFRERAGQPISYNETLSMMKALAELAVAADSPMYRSSGDATPQRLFEAVEEGPLAIAKCTAWRLANLNLFTLEDGTPCCGWNYIVDDDDPEDVGHAQFELGSLAVILENKPWLDRLLERAGHAERVPLGAGTCTRIANTFLRILWHWDTLSHYVDGSGDRDLVRGKECAGWLPFSQFDPWVWKRARDITFHASSGLRVDNHGALLRYRRFASMKTLTEFAGQNWLITPAALAVGEAAPATILDQKWLLVLSGVVMANQRGVGPGWFDQTVSFMPDMAGPDDPSATSGPLNWAIQKYGIPRPPGSPGTEYRVRFELDEWSPFVSLSSVFDQAESINAGYAVQAWRPNHFDTGFDAVTGHPVNNIFTGVNADLSVSDTDAWINRLGYQITLLGRIVFIQANVIL